MKTKLKKLDDLVLLGAIKERQESIDFLQHLQKGKYDIHYVISLLKMIDIQCQSKPGHSGQYYQIFIRYLEGTIKTNSGLYYRISYRSF